MIVFIVPTDTCFGIGCYIDDVKAYETIYKIKGRPMDKPMAIFVDDFERLSKITNLNKEQIDFLKNYNKPFTVLVDKKNIKDKKILDSIEKLPNKERYEKIAFRVATTFMQRKFVRKYNYFFLTSANLSGQPETKSTQDIKSMVENNIKKYNIHIFAHDDYVIPGKYYFSDIFEFIGNSTDLSYVRKNQE